MCGITGIYAFNEIGNFYKINLVKATEKLISRGPDQQGTIIHNRIGLGHRRLSILDTSLDGRQPMTDPTGRFTIVFNGEIFNFKELKEDLQSKGIQFVSNTDTEVLLHLFIQEKTQCLNKLNGFFAFAILDREDDSLFIARDRIGIKPLHIYQDEDKLIFASELKSIFGYNIPRKLNQTSLLIYLQLNYLPPPFSMIQNVRKLMPGKYLIIKNKEVFEDFFYKIPYQEQQTENNHTSYDELQNELIKKMEKSVQKRLISDVPLGCFLSGGIDSSVIVALASKHTQHLNTFSIGYKENSFFDETQYANLVAQKYKTNHTVFKLSNDDLFQHFESVLDYLDEPFADSSALALDILCKNTRKHVTVALSGDGADELFGGYNKYLGEYKVRYPDLIAEIVCTFYPLWKMLPKSRNGFLSNKIRQMQRYGEGTRMEDIERYWRWASFLSKSDALKLLKNNNTQIEEELNRNIEILTGNLGSNKYINNILYNDMQMVLTGDMLTKVDLMSMKNSLEVRVPFLDHEVVNFAFEVPSKFKVDGKMKKKIVQDAFRNILPKELYNRPKHGFEVPMLDWLKTEMRDNINKKFLSDDKIINQNIFQLEPIKKLKQQLFSKNPGDAHATIWALLVFQWWQEKYDVSI